MLLKVTELWLHGIIGASLARTVTKDVKATRAMQQLAGGQIWKEVQPLQDEYRELYEAYLAAAKYLNGDAMPRELKQRVNTILNKGAVRFNADALAEAQKPK